MSPKNELKGNSPRSKPDTDESDESSTSASGFIVMPVTKPDKKKIPASKKFTDEDEIALLKGMRLFWANGRNNMWSEFYGFIKEVLSHEFTRIQVSEKIRGMKTKFEANLKRARANGGILDFSENHEALLYELSKTLWGDRDRVHPSSIHDVNKLSTPPKNKSRLANKRKAEGKNKKIKKRPLEEDDASCALETTEKDAEEKAYFLEDGAEKDARVCKRKKEKKTTHVGHNDGEKKKNPASKKFTNEDEIALLKGLQLFWDNGRNNKWNDFYAFIKDDLPHEFTKIQVSEKIRRLKEKFEANLKRARANGCSLDVSENHEALLYELPKTLWGDTDIISPSSIHDGIKHSIPQKNKSRFAKKKKGEGKNQEVKKRPLKEDNVSCALETTKQDAEEKAPFLEDGAEEDARVRKRRDQRNSKRKKEKKTPHVGQNDGEKKVLVMQNMDIGKEEFESAFPLLCASFSELEHPCILREKCYLIGREKGRKLEEEWGELKEEELSLQLKRLDLMKRDLLTHCRKLMKGNA